MHRALRPIVDGQAWARTQTCSRADVDEDAAAVSAHMGNESLGGQQDRFDVDGEKAVDLRLFNLHERLIAMRDASVVDDDVDPPERVDRSARRSLDVFAA